MKNMILALFTLSIIGSSCSKPEETITPSTNLTIKQTRKPRQRKDFIVNPFGPGFCSGPGNNCGKKTYSEMTQSEVEQLDILKTYISSNNANGYFNTPNWEILLFEVNETPGLIDRIRNNEVHLYQIESGENDGSKTYVLSTASRSQEVATNNSIFAWQF